MSKPYDEMRSCENVRPVSIPNKKQYYFDLLNIEHSWTGRMDTNISNTFIMEAEQQLVNAMELFEKGYFDCAYYSLRSAVEVSTIMVFLTDMPEKERDEYFEAWKNTQEFPMQGQMIKQLTKQGVVYADMLDKMGSFFHEAKNLSAALNKYVHKQGLRHFYISRNHPFNRHKSQDNFIKNFVYYLEKCIGVVAVMRLAIDAFPILLMDEEILYRCFDSMTDPYSQEFVEKYIGKETIEDYKKTEIYSCAYESFANIEKKSEAVFSVMKHQYINSQKIDEIYKQLHLLSHDDIVCVLLVAASKKTVKVYACDGLCMYFTDRNTNRKEMSWSSEEFRGFENSKDSFNQTYGEAYISVLRFNKKSYFIEHNDLLTIDEAGEIFGFVFGALFKMGIIQED